MKFILLFALFVGVVYSQTCTRSYTVKSGDTCSGISSSQGVALQTIYNLNPSVNSQCTNLAIGQVLCLAQSGCTRTYTVVSGDTCSGIASSQGVALQTIYNLNPSVNSQCTNLAIGQVLCLANGGSTPTNSPTNSPTSAPTSTPSGSLAHIYQLWHCGNGDCEWLSTPPTSDSSWLLNRGDGKPTANVVVFSFMDPIALVNGQNGGGYTNGVPNGMIGSVSYFTSHGIRVIFSIGGAAWSDRFVSALNQNAAQFATNAANAALAYGVGIEIDVEVDSSSYISQLTTFVNTYRSHIPYQSGNTPSSPSILTIDTGAGTGFLSAISSYATTAISQNKINWLNAMVSDSPWGSISAASSNWQQHINAGLPANRMVVSQYSSNTCSSYSGLTQQTVQWAQNNGARGIAYWATGGGGGEDSLNCAGINQGSEAFLG